MLRLRVPLAALFLAVTSAITPGCDLASINEPITVTTDRIAYDFRVSNLVAGTPITLPSAATLTVNGLIPGGFDAQSVAKATIESVQIEQIVPSGAVYTLVNLQNVTFSLNGQNVATQASLSGTTATLARLNTDAAGVFTSNALRGSLAFTPAKTLGEEYGLRVSFVARVEIRN